VFIVHDVPNIVVEDFLFSEIMHDFEN
jgi:hypothetical protein